MKKVEVEEKLATMDLYTLKRWGALIDGLRLVDDKAKEIGTSVGVRRHHLIRYIDEVTEKTRIY